MAKKRKKKATETSRNPVMERVVLVEASDKYSDYPSSGLTPTRLAQIFREADGGDVYRQMQLFEEMEEKDPHLFSQLQTRKQAVTGLDWEVQPASEDAVDKEVAEWVKDQLEGLENLNGIMMDMLDAIGKGVSVMEILWGSDEDGQNVIEDIVRVHPKKLMWDAMTDEMRICTEAHPEGISLVHNKFVVHRYKAKSGHGARAGILRVVSWMYLFKNYSLKDWVAFCEVFGMPLRLGKYDASASKDDKAALMQAIVSLGSDAAGIVPTSTSIEFVQARTTGTTDTYEKLARYCDEQISKAVLGQTLTSDSGGGSYAQSKTHDEVRHDLTVADAKALSMTIRRDIIGPLVEYNYGPGVGIPLFEIDCGDPDDLVQAAQIYVELGTRLGLPIAEDFLYKKFNIPKPEEGQELIRPPEGMGKEQPGGWPSKEAMKEAMKEAVPEDDRWQEELDGIVRLGVANSKELFRQMFEPLKELADSCGSLEELKAALSDEERVREAYEAMDVPEFTDLLHQGIYLARLIGRVQP